MRRAVVEGKEYVFPDDDRTYEIRTYTASPNGGRRVEFHFFAPDGSHRVQVQEETLDQMVREVPLPDDAIRTKGRQGKKKWNGPQAKDLFKFDTERMIKENEERLFKEVRKTASWKHLYGKANHAGLAEESFDMKKLSTGTRVGFDHPGRKTGRGLGTVIDLSGAADPRLRLLPGHVLVCADEPGRGFDNGRELVGRGYGAVLPDGSVKPLQDQESNATFAGIPEHIGVVVKRDLEWDGIVFRRHNTGRLVSLGPKGESAIVDWHMVRHQGLYVLKGIDARNPGAHMNHRHCYSVPTKSLRWCRLDPLSGTAREIWPGTMAKRPSRYASGDYVVYASRRPTKVNGRDRRFGVAEGAILEIAETSSDGGCVSARIVSGCDERAVGLLVSMEANQLAPLGFPYFKAGDRVEIVAQLEFRKKDLQGERGTVVLPTDADGDVGIQFSKDIGAGSLDGQGEDRCCLYVPVEAVQTASE